MPLLPLDLILTVGSAAAAFILGFVVWSRNKWATGGLLYGLMAMSLALWTSADWFVSLQSTALPLQIFLWKLLFYAGVCYGSAFAMHGATCVSRHRPSRECSLAYAACTVAYASLAFGFILPVLGYSLALSEPFLVGGATLAFLLYVGAVFFIAVRLYPQMFSAASSVLERRRAAYGAVLFLLYIAAGALQVVVGPTAAGLTVPLLTTAFVILSLAAFLRASFLDVFIGPLETFLLLLTAFAVVLLLRSRTMEEAAVTLIGSVAVGTFGLLAVRTVRGERMKRVLLEEANRKLQVLEEARKDFVDMVAHQLRTPLGGIRASASMLANGDYGDVPDKARQAATLIEDSATRLLSHAETFLNMSRLEVGEYESRRVETDVRRELARITEEMRTFATTKQLSIAFSVQDDVPAFLRMDVEVLQNALFNLLDNAIKYTDRGGVTVSCRPRGGMLEFDVTDTGAGMGQEELRDLFKKFHRGDAARSHAQDGTGLGLYVVKRLVEAAGGRISASSPGPEEGSVFRFTLPASSS